MSTYHCVLSRDAYACRDDKQNVNTKYDTITIHSQHIIHHYHEQRPRSPLHPRRSRRRLQPPHNISRWRRWSHDERHHKNVHRCYKILWSRSPRRRIIAKISLSEQESEIRISSSGIISLSLSQPEPQRVNIYSLDIQLAVGDNDAMRTHQSLSQKNSPLRSRIATTHNCNIIAPLNRVLIGEIIKAPDI